MKSLRLLPLSLLLATCCGHGLNAAETALIKIDPDRTISEVDPHLYSSFLEPVQREERPGVVYGPLYDPASPFADANGFRSDYVAQIKSLNIGSVRWPGGNFVSGHHWMDAIGPKDQRPVTLDLSRSRHESNQMGTDEYVEFCRLIGAENFICINAGTGTIEEAAHWVEYTNAPAGTQYADLRVKYGHPEPYDVKFWALGNEPDGPWQLGHKNKEDYVKFALEAAKLMRAVDQDILLVAAGPSNYPLVTKSYDPKDGWTDWNDYVLEHMAGVIDYLSVHRYVFQVLRALDEDVEPTFADQMSLGLEIERIIEVTRGQIQKALVKTEAERPIYIAFDEYGARGNTLAGPLLLAQHLNAFLRHADIVKMANLTFLSSLAGVTPEGEYKTSLHYPFDLYSNHCRGTSLDVLTRCGTYDTAIFQDIPLLDVSAVLNEAEGKLFVNVVNRSETEAIETELDLQAGDYTGRGKVHLITADALDATNTIAAEQVRTVTSDLRFKRNRLTHTFPPHSLTQLEIDLKN